MELLLILVGGFFVIVVPITAFMALARSGRVETTLAAQKHDLLREIDDLRLKLDNVLALLKVRETEGAAGKVAVVSDQLPRKTSVPAVARKTRQSVVKSAVVEQEPQAAPAMPPPLPTIPVATTLDSAGLTVSGTPEIPSDLKPLAKPAKPARDLEELIGTRWAVWVGGLALAVGGLFLVRYSIEAGVFGPRVRLTMAAVFAMLLIAAGEALRRGVLMPKSVMDRIEGLPVAHAPLALTAAGVVSVFGTVYAAYAVYGFMSQTVAFLLMGGIGVGAIAASLLHGQALAGVGMLASYVTPVLVGGESKSRWPLILFLLAVTTAAMAVQNRLKSTWLAVGSILGVAIWTVLIIFSGDFTSVETLTFILAALVIFAAALVWLAQPAPLDTPLGNAVSLVPLMGLAAAIGLAFTITAYGVAAFVIAAIIALLLLVATSLRDGRAALAIVAAVLLPMGMILTWPSIGGDRFWLLRVLDGAMLAFVKPPVTSQWLGGLTIISAGLLLSLPLLLLFRKVIVPITVPVRVPHADGGLIAIAFAGGLAPVILAFAWALRTGVQTRDLVIAGLFAGLMILLWLISDRLYRRRGADQPANTRPGDIGSAAYASGAALALGLAIAFALPGLWMAVGFALAALALAFLNDRRPLPALRRVTAAMATTAVLRGMTSPAIFGSEAWPVLNWYLAAYGIPAIALAAAAYLLRKQATDRNLRVLESASLLAFAAFMFLQIRHAVHHDSMGNAVAFDYVQRLIGFHETWLFVCAGLGFLALGLFLQRRFGGLPARVAWAGGAAVMLISVTIGFGLVHNPFAPTIGSAGLARRLVSGYPIFNRLTLGYGIAILCLTSGFWLLRREKHHRASKILGIAAVVLGGFWSFTQIRMAFHGADLVGDGDIGLGEAGTYALVLIGLAVLMDRIPLRYPAITRLAPMQLLQKSHVATNVAALVVAIILCVFATNPWGGAPLVGPSFMDSSFVGYLLTGVGFAGLARLAVLRGDSNSNLVRVNRAAAIGLIYLYLITQVRRLFVGTGRFSSAPFYDAEQYSYSLITLLFGVALLGIGFRLASREIRLASAIFVTLAVIKVFLFDMAGLTGLWRAFSFIGLGAVLIGIGLAYQRLLFDRRKEAE